MSANSKIEWTDHTFNPWIGCTKWSPGCVNCYAETRDKRHLIEDIDHWGKGAPRYRTKEANWRKPRTWNACASSFRECTRCGYRNHMADGCTMCGCDTVPARQRVFCASQSDWLDDEVQIEWLADLLALIHATPHLDWLLLTKRPENWRERVLSAWKLLPTPEARGWVGEWAWRSERIGLGPAIPPHNVWIGTSVEDQTRADERIPALLQIPARIRFLSCEPLLGPVDVPRALRLGLSKSVAKPYVEKLVSWVIIGGESGPSARACDVQWVRSLVAQCQAAGVPAFVKQLGAYPIDNLRESRHTIGGDRVHMTNDRKGGDIAEWPEELRVREFPDSALRDSRSALP